MGAACQLPVPCFSLLLLALCRGASGLIYFLLVMSGLQGTETARTYRALTRLSKSFLPSSKGLQKKGGTIVRLHRAEKCLIGAVTSRKFSLCSG